MNERKLTDIGQLMSVKYHKASKNAYNNFAFQNLKGFRLKHKEIKKIIRFVFENKNEFKQYSFRDNPKYKGMNLYINQKEAGLLGSKLIDYPKDPSLWDSHQYQISSSIDFSRGFTKILRKILGWNEN